MKQLITQDNYPPIWTVFILCGLIAAAPYGFMHQPDKRSFPQLYRK